MIIRPARDSDRPLIAELHAESWRSIYRGVLSDEFLDRQIYVDFGERWRTQPVTDKDALLVAVGEEGELLGFCATWKQGDVAYIDNFHVSPAARSRGIGRAILAETGRCMHANGCASAYLTVVTSNGRARDLYIRLRGVPGEIGQHELGNTIVEDQRIDWPDITVLSSIGR